jgi:hypothetical protein
MKLNETVELMNSTDYKDRFRAEYLQLKINMLYVLHVKQKYHFHIK